MNNTMRSLDRDVSPMKDGLGRPWITRRKYLLARQNIRVMPPSGAQRSFCLHFAFGR
jgi:hypothetical protein